MKKKSISTTVGILLILGIVVMINLIANTMFARLDLTDGKVYSLSKASKQVVAQLNEPVTVKVFASKNLSPQLNDVKRFVNDLLSGYKTYGKGNFRYEFINPGTDEDLEREAQDYRIPPFQENVWNKDKLELKKVYLGAVFIYGDRQETIPTLRSTSGLEYNITSLIKRLSSQQEMTVGFLTGHGEASPAEGMQRSSEILKSNYNVTTVDLASEDRVPDDVDALLIIGPNQSVDSLSQFKIDQFIMAGKPVGFFYSPVETDIQKSFARNRPLGMDQWTSHYGFRVNSDLISDANCNMINIQERRGFFTIQNTINYPQFPNVITFNETHPVVSELDMISMFFPSSIDTTLWREKNVNMTPFMFSSGKTMVQSGRYNIAPAKEINESVFDRANLPLAASLTGSFESAFNEIPVGNDGSRIAWDRDLIAKSPEQTRLLVVGDGNLVKDDYLQNPSNVYMLLNAVDWLVGDTDLIQLRSREVRIRPLKDISDGQKQFWKYINWFLPPIIAILIGLVYWQVRRNRRYGED